MEKIILDTSLTSTKPSYNVFAELQQRIVQSTEQEVELHVDIEKRLGLSFLFCISTLPIFAKSRGKDIHIFCNSKSLMLFKWNRYIPDDSSLSEKDDIAPFLHKSSRCITAEADSVYELVTEITSDAPVKMSENLAALFTSKVGEMYNNSLEHSEGQYVIGGKYFKNQKGIYCFSCYDTGIGIPQKVKNSIDDGLSETAAFQWAMQRGHSTANKTAENKVPRGLGLGLLRSFAKANEGTIRICSGKVLYIYRPKKGSQYFELENKFEGTLFEMDIIADDQHKYVLG